MFWILLLLLLSFSWILPWWFYLVAAILCGLKARSAFHAFKLGFFATGLAWVMAAYFQDFRAEGQISLRLSKMFGFSQAWMIYPFLFVLIGISSGLFCWSGFYLAQLVEDVRSKKGANATQSVTQIK